MSAKRATNTKQVDGKGRLTLDKKFANRMVMVREVNENEILVTLARVIPESESWLYDNTAAKKAVFTGIEEARKKNFAAAPNLKADAALAKKLRAQKG
jgi:hypothetical protein